jgi:glyoxylase-like metal-dependent hydrolase (beta-lactamase superfamily II)
MGEALRWQIGDVVVHRVVDAEDFTLPVDMIEGATAELAASYPWAVPHFVSAKGEVLISFHTFLIRTPAKTIVVDTCLGENKERMAVVPALNAFKDMPANLLNNMRAIGVRPEDVDVVFCTHLHFDHVGWNVRREKDRWVPTFPKARYLFDKAELKAAQRGIDDDHPGSADYPSTVTPILDAGLADLIDAEGYAICDEVRLISTPGHTAGHASVLITSRGQQAVITGDMMHTPLQCAMPERHFSADADGVLAAQTRRDFLKRFCDCDTVVLGTHFPPPTAGWIESEGAVWRFNVNKRT